MADSLSIKDVMAQYGISTNPADVAPSPPAITTGLAKDANTLSQQKFGVSRPGYIPVNNTKPTYVPGVGMMGPDLGGAVAGDQARQQATLRQNEDSRQEEQLGMNKVELGQKQDYLNIAIQDLGLRKEDLNLKKLATGMELSKFSWAKEDRDKSQDIMKNMAAAGQAGGFSAVVDYLKGADPEKAVMFQTAKLKMDAAIMGNQVMQAQVPNELGKAMTESYGVIGKMGKAILDAPPESRNEMFKSMKPIMNTMFGDKAPETLEQFTPMALMAVAQATPENILYDKNKMGALMETDIGKTSVALQELAKQGKTPENDQTAADLAGRLAGIRAKDAKNQAEITKISAEQNAQKMQGAKDEGTLRALQMTADKDLSTRYLKETKGVGDFVDSKQNFDAAYNTWQDAMKKNEGQGPAETAMIRSLGMMFNKGTFSDADAAAFAGSDSNLYQLFRKAKSQYETTGAIVANPSEVKRLKGLMDNISEVKEKTLSEINGRYKEMENIYHISPNAVRYYSLAPKEAPAPAPMGQAQLQQAAQDAIKNGADPKAVQQRMNELMQKQAPTQQAQ